MGGAHNEAISAIDKIAVPKPMTATRYIQTKPARQTTVRESIGGCAVNGREIRVLPDCQIGREV